MFDSSEVVLVGSGGHARSVVDSILRSGKIGIAGTVSPSGELGYASIPNLGDDDVLQELRSQGLCTAHIAIGYLGGFDPRPHLAAKLLGYGYDLISVIDPSAAIARSCNLGKGVFVGKNAVINSNSCIGDLAIINSGSIVEHDCRIGEYAHVAVGAVLCGGVSVGPSALIGASATVLQGRSIGEGAIVGAGAIVVHDVVAGETVVGVH